MSKLPVLPIVLTVPSREPVTYFSQFADTFQPTIVLCDTTGRGAAEQTRQAFVTASARPDCHLLLAEDDVELHPSLGTAVGALLAPGAWPDDVGAISFCDMREMDPGTAAGLYNRSALGVDNRGWWGNQLLLVHREVVATIATLDWFSTLVESSPGVQAHKAAYGDGGRNCSDIRLSILVHHNCLRNRYAVHVPSLGFHQGVASRCFPDRQCGLGERYTRNWSGEHDESNQRISELEARLHDTQSKLWGIEDELVDVKKERDAARRQGEENAQAARELAELRSIASSSRGPNGFGFDERGAQLAARWATPATQPPPAEAGFWFPLHADGSVLLDIGGHPCHYETREAAEKAALANIESTRQSLRNGAGYLAGLENAARELAELREIGSALVYPPGSEHLIKNYSPSKWARFRAILHLDQPEGK